ncbi:MAG TPA: carboxypeptidase-like regulatory domain-containing protein, partial [Thermoanaerobaculia bacterium]|nr:carboxypeptidase-like regulatory domain-containing protein [Thermoanaerobaculia bacterium]
MRGTWRLWVAAVLAVLLAGGAPGSADPSEEGNALWVAESAGALKISTADGRMLLEIADTPDARAVAVDPWRSTVWLYSEQTLLAYGFDGSRRLAVPVALPASSRADLAVAPGDGSVWLAVGRELRSVSSSGQSLVSLRLPDPVETLAVDPAEPLLWIGTSRTAAAYDPATGDLVRTVDVGGPDLRDLDVDPGSGDVWVARKDRFRLYGSDGTLKLDQAFPGLLRVAADSTGGAWAATAKDLARVSAAGQILSSVQPFGGAGTIAELVTDPSKASAWVAAGTAVAQVDASGALVRAVSVQPPVHIWDLAVYASLDTPPDPELPPDPATVAPAFDPTVVPDVAVGTEFLYTGADPIQTGVEPGAIDPRRVAVLRGRVLDREGAPLPGARVTALGQPELGSTLSRADGLFDFAVNGGGFITLEYEKGGYLTAQRRVEAPWRDYAWADDVALVPFDPAVTAVASGAPVLQVARGSRSEDEDGARTATLLFPAGTEASMVLPDGSTRPLPSFNVRATEYTVGPNGPAAMPGPLPATTAYTYAVELSVDEAVAAGAKEVTFSKPVLSYVENFLGF